MMSTSPALKLASSTEVSGMICQRSESMAGSLFPAMSVRQYSSLRSISMCESCTHSLKRNGPLPIGASPN